MANARRAIGPFQDDVIALVDAIYAAAEDPKLWPHFLTRLRTTVRSTITAFIFDDLRIGHASVAAALDFDPKFTRLYEEYFAARNAWAIAAGPKLRSGSVVTSQEILPDRDLIRTEYYNDFLRPQDARHLLGSMPLVQAQSFAQVSLIRPGRSGGFSDRETNLMRALMPHLQRAIRMHQRFSQLEAKGQMAAEALDRAPFGVVLIDRNGRPLLVNKSASDIFAAGDGLILNADGLSAASHAETGFLKKLTHDATEREGVGDPNTSGAMTVSRPSMRRSYTVLVAPLCLPESAIGQTGAAAIVFLSDPEAKPHTDLNLLRRLYGFTPAESRLAAHLLEGESLEQAASALEVTLNTARTHLKNLHAKTDTHRQSELVRTLLGGLAGLRLE